MLHLLTLLLAPSPATLPEPPALIRMDHDDDHGHGHGRGHEPHGREGWDRDRRREDDYWKHERKWEKHAFHHDRDDDRDWDFDHPRHAHPTPPWMNAWWRPGERHYCAVVPGDPSQIFVFIGGRWERHSVYDPRFRADISGAFALPEAPPPPVPLPRLGLNLHIVLFN